MTPADAEGLRGSRCGYYSAAGTRHGTGHHTEYAHRLIEVVHSRGKLALTAIGTSQEGGRGDHLPIALMCKIGRCRHPPIGDTGVPGMAFTAEHHGILHIAIRGERHLQNGTVCQPLIIANCPQEFCISGQFIADCGNTRTGRRGERLFLQLIDHIQPWTLS